jgi:pyrroline-5-carboxylate reductase
MSILADILAQRPLLLIGCGKMGGALLRGWLRAGLSADGVHIVDPQIQDIAPPEAREASKYQSLDDVPSDLSPRLVLLAVKPQMMDAILPALGQWVGPDTLVLSIAAGIRVNHLQKEIGGGPKVIRAMPNTPSAIGKGVAVLVASRDCDGKDRALATRLFTVSGDVHWIEEESLMDAVTGLSGSGPAYFFLLVEAMSAGGVAAGLDPELAAALARRTAIGASALLESSDQSPEQLRRNVTSPKGTTEAALAILTKDGIFEELMSKAILAATKRGKELADP